MIKLLTFTVVILSVIGADACNVPVFRYALERWKSDSCEVVVFHDGPLSADDQNAVEELELASFENGGAANIKVVRQLIADAMSDGIGALWEELSQQNLTLPYVVVRSEVRGKVVNNWRGTLTEARSTPLLTSAVRETLSQRLLAGDSTVWLLLKSGNADRDAEVSKLLNEQLSQLSQSIPLPEGIGLPGSELFADVPLLMKFSVLEIDPDDKAEQFLIDLLTGFEPDAIQNGEPVVVPVFGRCRALEVIPANLLDAALIEDLTLFLSGACSCQVKERNPGFDLLTSTAWDDQLFGDGGHALPELKLTTTSDSSSPELMTIPPGRHNVISDIQEVSATSDVSIRETLVRQSAMLSLIIVLMVIVMIALVTARRVDI